MKKNEKITITSIDDLVLNADDYVLMKPHIYAKLYKKNDFLINIFAIIVTILIIISTNKIYKSIFPDNAIKIGNIAVTKENFEQIVNNVLIPVQEDIYTTNGMKFNKEEYAYYSTQNLDWVAYQVELGLKAKDLGYKIDDRIASEKKEEYGDIYEYLMLADILTEKVYSSYEEPTPEEWKKIYEATKKFVYIDSNSSNLKVNIYEFEDLEEFEQNKSTAEFTTKNISYADFFTEYEILKIPKEDFYIKDKNEESKYYFIELIEDNIEYKPYKEVEKDLKERYKYSMTEGVLDTYVAEMQSKNPVQFE